MLGRKYKSNVENVRGSKKNLTFFYYASFFMRKLHIDYSKYVFYLYLEWNYNEGGGSKAIKQFKGGIYLYE